VTVWCVILYITTARIYSYGFQGLCRGDPNRRLQRSRSSNLLWLERWLSHCWVGSTVSVSVNDIDTDVVIDVVGAIRSVIAMSGKRLRTIGFNVEPFLLGGPPLLDES
jgi:hypothetical protein